jgi:triosephosphate isomerase
VPEGASADRLVVAYEPVWAIGTGLTPTMGDVADMHAAIRPRLPTGTRILYGGSVNPRNAAEILALPDVDGALVGGASLKADDFWAIAQACG